MKHFVFRMQTHARWHVCTYLLHILLVCESESRVWRFEVLLYSSNSFTWTQQSLGLSICCPGTFFFFTVQIKNWPPLPSTEPQSTVLWCCQAIDWSLQPGAGTVGKVPFLSWCFSTSPANNYSSPGWFDNLTQFLSFSWFCQEILSPHNFSNWIKVWELDTPLHNLHFVSVESKCYLVCLRPPFC